MKRVKVATQDDIIKINTDSPGIEELLDLIQKYDAQVNMSVESKTGKVRLSLKKSRPPLTPVKSTKVSKGFNLGKRTKNGVFPRQSCAVTAK